MEEDIGIRRAGEHLDDIAATEIDKDALLSAVRAGDAEAMRLLAVLYKNGNGDDRDYSLMEMWLRRAADAGDPIAMWDLGYYHLVGRYLKQDTVSAVSWYRRAIDAGSADAAYELGMAYENGGFLERDLDKARECYQMALAIRQERMREAQEAGADEEAPEGPQEADAREAKEAVDRVDERRASRRVRRIARGTDARGADIVLRDVTKRYGRKVVLDGISLDIRGGELIAIVGGSGSGKSTMARVILGKERPTRGKVSFRGSYSFVPQANLVHEWLTVEEQLDYYAGAVKRLPRKVRRERILQIMDALDLTQAGDRLLAKCSGGEVRRVSVACELLSNPDSMVLDEPTAGLDPGDAGDLIELLGNLSHDNRMTCIVINHDYENILLFDKIIFLAGGGICFYGTPERLFDYFATSSPREIYRMIRENPVPYIRRFEEWRRGNPDVAGGIA